MNNKKKPLTYLTFTYGCQMNEHDSEVIAGMLNKLGIKETDDVDNADIIIFNTCCVRQHAEERVFGRIGQLKKLKAKNPNLIIAVGGCMVQQKGMAREIAERFPYVDILFGTHNNHNLPQMIEDVMNSRETVIDIWDREGKIIENLPIKRADNVKAWVPITYGCNNFCSYCIVPYVRGRERSRALEDILREVKSLASEGYREITLLGQNVNSYGKDLKEKLEFADLLYALDSIEGIYRIRFMTSHPKDLSDSLIEAIQKCPSVCEHIHLPLQSGSNKILKLMNRNYTREHFERLVNKIREHIPSCSITTDIIVGFPGETHEDFLDTLDIVKRIEFDSAFTFMFSKRKGTPAADMPGQIDSDTKKDRLHQLMTLQKEITYKKNQELKNKILDVLVEGINETKNGKLIGRTRTNKIVYFEGNRDMIGQIINVRIIEPRTWTLIGEFCGDEK